MFELLLSFWGYLSIAWVIVCFFVSDFRNQSRKETAYGIILVCTILVALNIGGILNEDTWAILGSILLGLHGIVYYRKGLHIVAYFAWFVAVSGAAVVMLI